MNEQGDLFASKVVKRGMVRFYTSHVDGAAVYWAIRWDYARSFDGRRIQHVNEERAGPFATIESARLPFGKETGFPDFNKI